MNMFDTGELWRLLRLHQSRATPHVDLTTDIGFKSGTFHIVASLPRFMTEHTTALTINLYVQD